LTAHPVSVTFSGVKQSDNAASRDFGEGCMVSSKSSFSLLFVILAIACTIPGTASAEAEPVVDSSTADACRLADSVVSREVVNVRPNLWTLPYRNLDTALSVLYRRTDVPGQDAWYLQETYIGRYDFGRLSVVANPLAYGRADYQRMYFGVPFGHSVTGFSRVYNPQPPRRVTGTIEGITDNTIGTNHDRSWYAASLAAPLTDKLSLRGTVQRSYFGEFVPSVFQNSNISGLPNHLPRNERGFWDYNGSVNYRFGERSSASVTVDGISGRGFRYDHGYLFNSGHMPYFEEDALRIIARYARRLNDRWTLNLASIYSDLETFEGDGLYKKDLLSYDQPGSNPRFDTRALFWLPGHVADLYIKQHISAVGGRADLAFEYSPRQRFFAGAELQRYTVRSFQHNRPSRVGIDPNNINRFGFDSLGHEIESDDDGFNAVKHPVDAAIFVGQTLALDRVNLRLGLRFDYFDYDTWGIRNYISYVLRPGMRAFGSAGHVYRRPDFDQLYAGESFLAWYLMRESYDFVFGNGNLKPPKESFVELGTEITRERMWAASGSVYRKSVSGLPMPEMILGSPGAYGLYTGACDLTIIGADLMFFWYPDRNLHVISRYSIARAEIQGPYQSD
jgi:hypothetical protein